MDEPEAAAVPGGGMFGGEGHRVLDGLGPRLFPATVRPAFLRLLWGVLVVLGIAAGFLVAALAGRLP